MKRQQELEEHQRDFPSLSHYDQQHQVDVLDDRIGRYVYQDAKRHEGDATLVPLRRVNASLISEVTGEQYPLLLAAGPMPSEDGIHRWFISDTTDRNGDGYPGRGSTPSEAFFNALDRFGREGRYGRGKIGVRTTGLGLEAGAQVEKIIESAKADWDLAEGRIDDLVTTLVALGLVFTTAGTAGAVIGAGLAMARLLARWRAGRLELDEATVGDLLGLFGGLAAAGDIIATKAGSLAVKRLGKAFVILEDASATEAQLAEAVSLLQTGKNIGNVAANLAKGVEAANKVLNYGGLVWGEVTFVDHMLAINEAERSGQITHAAARRQRSEAIGGAVQNHALFLAGEVKAAKARAKAASGQGSAGEGPVRHEPGVSEPTVTEPNAKDPGGGKAHDTESAGARPGQDEPAVKKRAEPKADATEPAPNEPTPREKGTEPVADEQESKPSVRDNGSTQKAPAEDVHASPEELRDALPADLRDKFVVDERLEGDSVEVTAERDPDNRSQILDVVIRVGPHARPRSVALHANIARIMLQYRGFSGQLRRATAWIGKLIGWQVITPENPQLWKAQLEVGKLPGLIQEQIERMRTMDDSSRDHAEAELESLRNQFAEHMETLLTGTEAASVALDPVAALDGSTEALAVAARGVSAKNRRAYAELKAELARYTPGSDNHRKTRRKMYELSGGTWDLPRWKNVYDSNVEQANKANAVVAAEHERVGFGQTEVTLDPGTKWERRLDIASEKQMRGIEVKAYESGRITATEPILNEVVRDARLVKLGWQITWVLIDTDASPNLLSALYKAGITVQFRTATATGTEFVRRILPPR